MASRGNNRQPRIGIVLSGWAPAMTLMSGVMLGFIKEGISFEVVSTSGIGALIALLYLAPKGKTNEEALKELPNLFVSNLLHRLAPLNFKMFYKNSPFAQLWYELREQLPKIPVDPGSASPAARFVNDSMDLVATAVTPPTLESYRNALMSQVSMMEERVDFNALRDPEFEPRLYLNAFDLAAKRQRIFSTGEIAADAYRAAQAMFLMFPPEPIDGELYTTGATHDPTGLQAIWMNERANLDMVIALDPVAPAIWRPPVNVHDAFQLMLLNPIVALQVLTFALYAETESAINAQLDLNAQPKLPRLYRLPFDVAPCKIPAAYYPQMLEWTHKNAVTLECIGRCAAEEFAKFAKRPGFWQEKAFDARYRYAQQLDDRSQYFLRIFRQLHLFDREFWAHPAAAKPEKPRNGRRRTDSGRRKR